MLALSEARRATELAEKSKQAIEAARRLEEATKSDSLLLARYGQALTEAQTLARAP
jgi:hypothetical protein